MGKFHIWIGLFEIESAKDYFKEHNDKKDHEAISKFAEEQGEVWIDHDCLEARWQKETVSLEKIVNGLSPKIKTKVLNKALATNLNRANLLLLCSEKDAIKTPKTVISNNFTLEYLGWYEYTETPVSLEERIEKAERGDSKTQATLGGLYLFSPPNQKHIQDFKKAEYWLLKAVQSGEQSTYNRLYHLYYTYLEEGIDYDKAFYWIEKAALVGWRTDQMYCSQMYEKGHGIKQNNIMALKWRFLSVCQYNSESLDHTITPLLQKMTEDEIKESEKLALDWIESKNYDADRFTGYERNPLSKKSIT